MHKLLSCAPGFFRTSLAWSMVSALACLVASPLLAAPTPKPGYQSFIVGNPADAPPPQGLSAGLVLMGGGLDVDAAFQH